MIDAALSKVIGIVGDAGKRLLGDNDYPVPIYRITVADVDIAHLISPRLISLNLTDNRGIEADTLDISLSDHDGLLNIPPKGVELRLWLGWSNTGLVFKGTFTADEAEHSGAPDVLNIRARSADLRKQLKTKREGSWSNTTLATVLQVVAGRNNLKPMINAALGALPILQLDQANESDANLLTRLGEEFDAVATVKAGWRANADGSSAGPIIVNSSRAVLYASSGEDFEAAARRVAMQTRDMLEAAKPR